MVYIYLHHFTTHKPPLPPNNSNTNSNSNSNSNTNSNHPTSKTIKFAQPLLTNFENNTTSACSVQMTEMFKRIPKYPTYNKDFIQLNSSVIPFDNLELLLQKIHLFLSSYNYSEQPNVEYTKCNPCVYSYHVFYEEEVLEFILTCYNNSFRHYQTNKKNLMELRRMRGDRFKWSSFGSRFLHFVNNTSPTCMEFRIKPYSSPPSSLPPNYDVAIEIDLKITEEDIQTDLKNALEELNSSYIETQEIGYRSAIYIVQTYVNQYNEFKFEDFVLLIECVLSNGKQITSFRIQPLVYYFFNLALQQLPPLGLDQPMEMGGDETIQQRIVTFIKTQFPTLTKLSQQEALRCISSF